MRFDDKIKKMYCYLSLVQYLIVSYIITELCGVGEKKREVSANSPYENARSNVVRACVSAVILTRYY